MRDRDDYFRARRIWSFPPLDNSDEEDFRYVQRKEYMTLEAEAEKFSCLNGGIEPAFYSLESNLPNRERD